FSGANARDSPQTDSPERQNRIHPDCYRRPGFSPDGAVNRAAMSSPGQGLARPRLRLGCDTAVPDRHNTAPSGTRLAPPRDPRDANTDSTATGSAPTLVALRPAGPTAASPPESPDPESVAAGRGACHRSLSRPHALAAVTSGWCRSRFPGRHPPPRYSQP